MYRYAEPLNDKKLTANRIRELIKKYYNDLSYILLDKTPLKKLSLKEFYTLVKEIPYRKDTKPIEVISRPKHILNLVHLGMDCKKKTILIGSYLYINKIPFKLVGSSTRPDKKIHHIYVMAKIKGSWKNIDATYNDNTLFEKKNNTKTEIL